MRDSRIAVAAIAVGMAFSLTAQAECTTLDFEDSVTGTPVFGLYTVSPLLSIYGDEAMEVLQEDLTDPNNSSILAYNSNGNGSNGPGGENWLPGDDNAKSFGNASTVRGATSQDLLIEFNPDIDVASFAIDISDFGDWFPMGGSDPRNVTLTAYDSDGLMLVADTLGINYDNPGNDVYNAGLRNLAVTVNNAAIAFVTLNFEDVDPGVSFDNIEVCEIQQASIEVTDVVLNTDPETIGYCISNEAGGSTTWVTLGDVTVSVGKKVKGVFTASCTIDPALGTLVTLEPGEQICYEEATCTAFESKTKAMVEVDGATNQLGELREKVWHDTSE